MHNFSVDTASLYKLRVTEEVLSASIKAITEVVSAFEAMVNFYHPKRLNIPEDSHLHLRVSCPSKEMV
jgi:hypothetical protein